MLTSSSEKNTRVRLLHQRGFTAQNTFKIMKKYNKLYETEFQLRSYTYKANIL